MFLFVICPEDRELTPEQIKTIEDQEFRCILAYGEPMSLEMTELTSATLGLDIETIADFSGGYPRNHLRHTLYGL